jgi:undecaprenyl-diphosphatase
VAAGYLDGGIVDLLSAVVLAIVQGLTEFWPISSSGHLILVPRLLGWPDQGLSFDVALHFGTLVAVVIYFRREVVTVPRAWLASVAGQPHDPLDARLGTAVLIATVPAGIAGLLLEEVAATAFRSPTLIAGTTAGYGLLLWWADRRRGSLADERNITLPVAIAIGCAQALAIVPGTSRSGVTMTAGLLLGLSRHAATRFSFLLSIPVILLAALVEGWRMLTAGEAVDWIAVGTGIVVAAITAYACIAALIRVVERVGMAPFAIYRLILAAIILTVL